MLNDVFPKRPFVNMNFPATETTTIVQSTNKEPSLHCYHKQARVKWSNCPFSPLPILSLPPFSHQTTGSGSSSVSRSRSLYTHLTSPDSESQHPGDKQSVPRKSETKGWTVTFAYLDYLSEERMDLGYQYEKGSYRYRYIFTKLELFYPRLFGGIQIEDCSQPPLSSMADPL